MYTVCYCTFSLSITVCVYFDAIVHSSHSAFPTLLGFIERGQTSNKVLTEHKWSDYTMALKKKPVLMLEQPLCVSDSSLSAGRSFGISGSFTGVCVCPVRLTVPKQIQLGYSVQASLTFHFLMRPTPGLKRMWEIPTLTTKTVPAVVKVSFAQQC